MALAVASLRLFSPLSIRELNAYLGVLLRPLSEMMYIMRFV